MPAKRKTTKKTTLPRSKTFYTTGRPTNTVTMREETVNRKTYEAGLVNRTAKQKDAKAKPHGYIYVHNPDGKKKHKVIAFKSSTDLWDRWDKMTAKHPKAQRYPKGRRW